MRPEFAQFSPDEAREVYFAELARRLETARPVTIYEIMAVVSDTDRWWGCAEEDIARMREEDLPVLRDAVARAMRRRLR